jgi:hypothetical protein
MNVRELHPRIAALEFAVRHILNESCGFRGSSSYRPRRYRPGGLLPGELSSGGLGSSDIVPEIWAPVVSLGWSGPDRLGPGDIASFMRFLESMGENQRGYNER